MNINQEIQINQNYHKIKFHAKEVDLVEWYDKYDNTHRCKKLLDSNCSIRHFTDAKDFVSRILSGWVLFKLEDDPEYNWKGLSQVTKIEYCPFCGEKLA